MYVKISEISFKVIILAISNFTDCKSTQKTIKTNIHELFVLSVLLEEHR